MNEEQPKRSRTISWEDPTPAIQQSKTMSGLHYLQALQTGDVPAAPIATLLGMWIVEVSEGRIVFAAEPGEYEYNPIGTVHGGIAATLLDSAMGCAVHSTLPAGTAYTTLETQRQLLALYDEQNRRSLLRRQGYSCGRKGCDSRGAINGCLWQVVSAWNDDMYCNATGAIRAIALF